LLELAQYTHRAYFLCLLKLIYQIELIRKPSKANQPLGILFLQVYSGPLLLLSGLGTGCATLLCRIPNTSIWDMHRRSSTLPLTPLQQPLATAHTRAHTPENPMEKLKLVIFYDFIKIEIKINSYMILRFVLVVFFYMNTRFFLPFF
jgi:hypothetical protein